MRRRALVRGSGKVVKGLPDVERWGRFGEAVVMEYLTESFRGKGAVKWVNEHGEKGYPYDIVVVDKSNGKWGSLGVGWCVCCVVSYCYLFVIYMPRLGRRKLLHK